MRPRLYSQGRGVKLSFGRAVLFDMDGVLVLTDQLKAEAHANVVRQLGGNVPPSFYERHMGKSHALVRQAFLAEAGIHADLERYSRLYDEKYRALLQTKLKAAPGSHRLLALLMERGFILGVVSSSRSWMMDHVLRETRLKRFFSVVVASEDVQHPKPAPDAYVLALQRLGMGPSGVAAFEDSESGVEAAVGAGLVVFAVRHPFNRGHDFRRAARELSSLDDTQAIVSAVELLAAPVLRGA